jgi:hypothetical protein
MRKAHPPERKIGAEPRYRFILNPYQDARFTRCPDCDRLMKVRKIPLLIHIDPRHLLALRKTVKYCPPCDLLIAHQDELEPQLHFALEQRAPEAIGNDYFVFGTLDVEDWKQGQTAPAPAHEALEGYHPFKEYLNLEFSGGWQRVEESSG